MRVLIVGAGLGGLSAAISFARQGHDVEVLEQRDQITPAGSGLNIRPPAARVLHSWGLRQDLESISEDTPAVVFRSLKTGNVATRTVSVDAADEPDWSTRRKSLIEVLHRRARDAGAKITFNATIVEVDDDAQIAVAKLSDGSAMEADLILAADGIRSRIRKQILHDVTQSIDPILSDLTLYGMQVDYKEMIHFPELNPLTDQVYLNVFMGHKGWVVSRYIRKIQSYSAFFGVKGDTDQQSMWDEKGDMDYVRNFFRDACPELKKVLDLVPSCDRWKLAELPHLPRWTSKAGRIILLGDSAHAMHPNAAHGYSQIVEDIGVLECLVSENPNPSANVPTITSDWQCIRKPRVDRIKEWAKFNSDMFVGRPDTGGTKESANSKWVVNSLKNKKADPNAAFNTRGFLKWTQSYDVVDETIKYLQSKRSRL